ncbi:MAG: hypothetical protein ACRD26_22145, partial [Vicinamibacterales bacterium]
MEWILDYTEQVLHKFTRQNVSMVCHSVRIRFRPLSGSLRELCTRFERASRGGSQADGLQEGVEVGDDALVET